MGEAAKIAAWGFVLFGLCGPLAYCEVKSVEARYEFKTACFEGGGQISRNECVPRKEAQ